MFVVGPRLVEMRYGLRQLVLKKYNTTKGNHPPVKCAAAAGAAGGRIVPGWLDTVQACAQVALRGAEQTEKLAAIQRASSCGGACEQIRNFAGKRPQRGRQKATFEGPYILPTKRT